MNRITFDDDYAAPFLDEMEDGPERLSRAEEAAWEADRAFTIPIIEPCPFCGVEMDEDGNCACSEAATPLIDLLETVERLQPGKVERWAANMRGRWTPAKY